MAYKNEVQRENTELNLKLERYQYDEAESAERKVESIMFNKYSKYERIA